MTVHVLKALQDNYIYLIENQGNYLVIDPSEAKPVVDFLKKNQVKLDAILITHHHSDHVGGVPELITEYSPKIYATDFDYDFKVDTLMQEGHEISIIGLAVKTLKTPGHTLDPLSLLFS